jgi:hypothetical protein
MRWKERRDAGLRNLIESAEFRSGKRRTPSAFTGGLDAADYRRSVGVIIDWIAAEVPNLHPVGRNGMHRHNNCDHSMY